MIFFISGCWDTFAVSETVRDNLEKCYPKAKLAHLKTGGNFPFLTRSDEINLHILVRLFIIENAYIRCEYKTFDTFYRYTWKTLMKNNGLWFIVIQAGHIWLPILKEEKIDITVITLPKLRFSNKELSWLNIRILCQTYLAIKDMNSLY